MLMVDDDRWTIRGLTAVLSGTPGLELLEPVSSGEEAIRAYRAFRPDVVLMDINMSPGISGIEATAAILRDDPDARVIALTTIAPGPGLVRVLEAGALAAVDKDASSYALIEMIRIAAAGDDPALLGGLAADVFISGNQDASVQTAVPRLTAVELETLQLICKGRSYDEIAESRSVSPATVKDHARHLREKLDAANLAQLVVKAVEYRFISS
nr:response regulator transcription factor [Leucobacter weissii]